MPCPSILKSTSTSSASGYCEGSMYEWPRPGWCEPGCCSLSTGWWLIHRGWSALTSMALPRLCLFSLCLCAPVLPPLLCPPHRRLSLSLSECPCTPANAAAPRKVTAKQTRVPPLSSPPQRKEKGRKKSVCSPVKSTGSALASDHLETREHTFRGAFKVSHVESLAVQLRGRIYTRNIPDITKCNKAVDI